MQKNVERARELVPAIILTLLSMIQALAAVYGVATAASHVTMRRARRDPANDYFFVKMGPASWRDYLGSMTAVITLAIMGIVLWVSDCSGYLPILALSIALVALLYQFRQARRYWIHSLVPNAATPAPDRETRS